MSGGRQHFRIKDNLPVRWNIEGGLSGEGVVLDMSTNGIKLITDKSFDPPDKCVVNIEPSVGGHLPFGPKKSVIRWFQKVMRGEVECVVCGLEFIILILFLISFTAPLYAAEYPWQLKTSKDGIIVNTRKVEGSPILEFKAAMTVDAPLSKIIPLFEDQKKLASWYYQCTHVELVKDEGPESKILYIVLRLPWPVTERDAIFRRIKTVDDKNSIITYSIQALPDMLPARSGKIRVLMINSIWRFTSLPDGKTEIYFQQHSNPGGSIPAFLVNALAVDTPFNSLKNFRQLIGEQQ